MPALSAADLLTRFKELPVASGLLSRLGGKDGIYLVGGTVRDLLLARAPHELDLAVEGEIDEVARRIGAPSAVHGRFSTATTELEGMRIDLARCRRERYAHPGALPEVEPAPLGVDLERRDFTVNAIALALTGERAEELTTVAHALDDLQGKRLRVLHPGSFRDDPTRLLRLARYSARLAFTIEAGTERLAREALAAGALGWISGDRLGSELRLLAAEEDPLSAFNVLRELGLREAIAPGFGLGDPARARRAVELLGSAGHHGSLVLGMALEGVERAERTKLVDRLGFAAAQREVLLAVAGRAGPLAEGMRQAQRCSEIAAVAEGAAPELLAAAGARGPEDQVREWLDRLRHVHTEIDGGDLLAAGVSSGPRIGVGLRAALAAKLDGEAEDRAAELRAALGAIGDED